MVRRGLSGDNGTWFGNGVHMDQGFPGDREVLERELAKSTTQVLFLAPLGDAGSRSLLERGASLVRGVELVPSAERFWTAGPDPSIVEEASADGIPADIAEAYMRARSEVEAILAEAFPGQ